MDNSQIPDNKVSKKKKKKGIVLSDNDDELEDNNDKVEELPMFTGKK